MKIASVADVKAHLSSYLKASAAGPVVVTSSGILEGFGQIGGALTNNGGRVAPGTPGNIGTLTIVEAVVSMIYPIAFIFRGHYTPQPAPAATTEQK